MRLERSGPPIPEDEALRMALAGDLVLEARTGRAGYCVNGWYWADDVALNTVIVVATSTRLVRAAELVAAGDAEEAMAAAVETDLLGSSDDEPTVADLDQQTRDEWPERDLLEYLAATAESPSPEAAGRFVVYAVSQTIWDQFIYFVDLDRANRTAIARFAQMPDLGSDDIVIAGTDTPIRMNSRDCDELEFP